ncbi:hypothetical protein AK88_02432 [Plasmodium fragile]|uniref:Uncharacterized protein n=1 Tax=Plasmodium fragile TaxID=5857 RepID=A0A0D9QM16_PLAFR|nr:uncharacterized protein AK88_02432 [Plasmodium fragile]KJP87993.1 hypothetical protein AK88_02432 [Plasmodium fragile]
MININTNSKNETHEGRKKKSPSILTLCAIANFNHKNVRLVKLTTFVSIVLLSLLFLNCHSSLCNGKKYGSDGDAFQGELSLPNGRILANKETFNAKPDSFFTFKDENDEKLRRGYSPYLKVYTNINDLNELSVKSFEIWKKVIQNMKDYFYSETIQMDERWRNYMWTMVWENHYIKNVHRIINNVLQDLNNTVAKKENIINTWFLMCEEDLEFFLECVNEQWLKVVSNKHNKTVQGEQTMIEDAKNVKNQFEKKLVTRM